jgi:hypothetical protein
MSSAVLYSNAFKLKTELQGEIDSLLSFADKSLSSTTDSSDASLYGINSNLATATAKIDQLDKMISELYELGRKEMIASKRQVVTG